MADREKVIHSLERYLAEGRRPRMQDIRDAIDLLKAQAPKEQKLSEITLEEFREHMKHAKIHLTGDVIPKIKILDTKNAGANIRRIRNSQGMTLKQLAWKTGISYQAIGQYERGERKPDFIKLVEIARAMNVPMDDILGDQEAEEARARNGNRDV